MRIYSYLRLCFGKYASTNLQRIVEKVVEYKLLRSFYSSRNHNSSIYNNDVIAMIDGRVKHGGLTDRINGLVSTYKAAQKSNRNFKIKFDFPFRLETFLEPNVIPWETSTSNLSYGADSKPIFIRSINNYGLNQKKGDRLVKIIETNPHKQLHVYTNIIYFSDKEFSSIFQRLFRVSPRLQKEISVRRDKIGPNYISATFRFQQLLGDFKEGDYDILRPDEQRVLIQRNIEELKELHKKFPNDRIFVSSDSITFLNLVKALEFVDVSDGELVHMQYNGSNNFETHARAFIDLFLIAHAKMVFSITIGPMYESGFPKLAAKIYLKPYHSIQLKS